MYCQSILVQNGPLHSFTCQKLHGIRLLLELRTLWWSLAWMEGTFLAQFYITTQYILLIALSNTRPRTTSRYSKKLHDVCKTPHTEPQRTLSVVIIHSNEWIGKDCYFKFKSTEKEYYRYLSNYIDSIDSLNFIRLLFSLQVHVFFHLQFLQMLFWSSEWWADGPERIHQVS